MPVIKQMKNEKNKKEKKEEEEEKKKDLQRRDRLRVAVAAQMTAGCSVRLDR